MVPENNPPTGTPAESNGHGRSDHLPLSPPLGDDPLVGPLGVEPTALGKLVLTRARSVLPAVDSLHTEAACLMAGQRAPEQLRLGARTGPAMMGLVQTVRLVAPQSQVVTESEIRIEGLIDMVSAGRVDAVVINEFVDHDIPTGSEVVRRCLATQPAFVMMSETHALAEKDEVSLADLAEERWVLDLLDVDMEHDVFAAACDAEGFVPHVEHYLHGSPNVEFVRRGFLGLCFPMAQFAGIVTKPISGSPIRFRHLLLVPQTSFLAEHVDIGGFELRPDLLQTRGILDPPQPGLALGRPLFEFDRATLRGGEAEAGDLGDAGATHGVVGDETAQEVEIGPQPLGSGSPAGMAAKAAIVCAITDNGTRL